MSKLELDFFGIHKKITKQHNTIRGIQSSISRLNPALLRSVIGAPNRSLTPPPMTLLPVLSPTSAVGSGKQEGTGTSSPLTIFYEGMVHVYNVERNVAETVIKVAEAGDLNQGMIITRGDLPMARKKSLQRFLEKRKERLTAMSPYSASGDEAGLEKKGTT